MGRRMKTKESQKKKRREELGEDLTSASIFTHFPASTFEAFHSISIVVVSFFFSLSLLSHSSDNDSKWVQIYFPRIPSPPKYDNRPPATSSCLISISSLEEREEEDGTERERV